MCAGMRLARTCRRSTDMDPTLLPISSSVCFSEPDWMSWMTDKRYRPNVVIESRHVNPDLVVAALETVFQKPLYHCRLPTMLNLPCEASSTVVIWDAAQLTREQQAELHQWIGRCRPAAQVIAVTATRLYDLVETNQFDAGLFYRVNMATMTVTENRGDD